MQDGNAKPLLKRPASKRDVCRQRPAASECQPAAEHLVTVEPIVLAALSPEQFGELVVELCVWLREDDDAIVQGGASLHTAMKHTREFGNTFVCT